MSDVFNWIKTNIVGSSQHGFVDIIIWIAKGIVDLRELWIVIALIGVYIIIFGNRRLGTKFTSVSILTYIIAKALARC